VQRSASTGGNGRQALPFEGAAITCSHPQTGQDRRGDPASMVTQHTPGLGHRSHGLGDCAPLGSDADASA